MRIARIILQIIGFVVAVGFCLAVVGFPISVIVWGGPEHDKEIAQEECAAVAG